MQAALCWNSSTVGLNKHPVSSSTHRTVYYHGSLDGWNLPHISNRPQQTPSLNGWEKSHITRCALVLACRTSFLPKQSIVFCSSSSAQDSLQVSVTAADTVTGSAIKHTALGCVVRVSQGTKMLFFLASKQQKSSCCSSLSARPCVATGAAAEPQNPKQVKSVAASTAGLHPGGFCQSPSLCLPSAEHSAMVFLLFLASLVHLGSCSVWGGEGNSMWQKHELSLQTPAFRSQSDMDKTNLEHFSGTWPQPTAGEDVPSGFAEGRVLAGASGQGSLRVWSVTASLTSHFYRHVSVA